MRKLLSIKPVPLNCENESMQLLLVVDEHRRSLFDTLATDWDFAERVNGFEHTCIECVNVANRQQVWQSDEHGNV